MPSPMDEHDNITNIAPIPDDSCCSTSPKSLKRNAETMDELVKAFPVKKVAMVIPVKSNMPSPIPENTKTAKSPQPKANREEREALKVEKAKEKELERQKKEHEKQKREEERLKREEEKMKRVAEKEEAKKKRDAEKEEARIKRERIQQEKEEERRKKEEEIEKKNRAQTRLNNFFGVPKKKVESPVQRKPKTLSDYQKYFQPFYVRQDVTVAPINALVKDLTDLQTTTALVDSVISHQDESLPASLPDRLRSILHTSNSRKRGHRLRHTAKEIMHLLNEQPSNDPHSLLSDLPRKHLQFAEDVRPAYNGTFTRPTKLTPRNPFKRDNEAFAYEYDSEAEWEFEPEDGENLDEESADDEDGSMMGDSGDEEDRAFLDDEDDVDAAKYKGKGKGGKRVIAPLVPVIKGVCWEVGGVQEDELLSSMRARVLLFDEKGEGIRPSIDPFSADYWITDMPPPPPPKLDSQLQLKKADTMGGLEVVKGSAKSKTPFPESHLKDFLQAIQGSTDNQTLLVELLKKRFPTATKGGIAEKLKEVAFRTGRKDTDHWEIKKEYLSIMGN